MARNQRRRAQEALFSPAPSTTPPEKPIPGFKADSSSDEALPIRSIPPEEHISRKYGIEQNCTNVPRLLFAILCEVVRSRV